MEANADHAHDVEHAGDADNDDDDEEDGDADDDADADGDDEIGPRDPSIQESRLILQMLLCVNPRHDGGT